MSEILNIRSPDKNLDHLVFKSPLPEPKDEGPGITFYITSEEMEAIQKIPKSPSEPTIAPDSTPSEPSEAEYVDLIREQKAFQNIGSHPNIVTFLGLQTIDNRSGLILEKLQGEDCSEVFMGLSLVLTYSRSGEGKTLFTLADYWGVMQTIFTQLCLGVEHIHRNEYVHGDIKPDNLMFKYSIREGKENTVKLIDLGYCCPKGSLQPNGHELYAAPEIMNATMNGEQLAADPASDVFAIGLLILKAFQKSLPLMEIKTDRLRRHIERLEHYGGGRFIGTERSEINVIDPPPLLTKEDVFAAYPQIDGTLKQCIEDMVCLTNKLTQPLPQKRCSVTQALNHPFLKKTLINSQKYLNNLQNLSDHIEYIRQERAQKFLNSDKSPPYQ